jgi:hypothetical protein
MKEEDEEDTVTVSKALDMELRSARYQLEVVFSEASRNLTVKDIYINYSPDRIYGSRDGVAPALMIMANSKSNVFKRSKLYMKGAVWGIEMLFCPQLHSLSLCALSVLLSPTTSVLTLCSLRSTLHLQGRASFS